MNRRIGVLAAMAVLPLAAIAEEQSQEEALAKHKDGSTKVADLQDELSADAQQLAIEQTVPKVIELLGEVKSIMDEATDLLAESDTGGRTLAAQTEIIEKIHAAAQAKQQQSGSPSGSAMMDMMERMMGKEPGGDQKEKNGQPGDTGGQGMTGQSDAANGVTTGETNGKSEARRVPKANGNAGQVLPEEFRKAMDAYNRGAEQKAK